MKFRCRKKILWAILCLLIIYLINIKYLDNNMLMLVRIIITIILSTVSLGLFMIDVFSSCKTKKMKKENKIMLITSVSLGMLLFVLFLYFIYI